MKTTSLAAAELLKTHRSMCNCDNAHGICQLFVGLIDSYHDEVVAGYKAQVAGQAHYIKCLLDEIRELKEAIREQDNANGNG